MADPCLETERRLTRLEAQLQSSDRALEMQAREYERRLTELNHAHARALEAQAGTVPREVYDDYVKRTREWHREVDRRLDLSAGAHSFMAAMVMSAIALVGALVSLLKIFGGA
jgi:hypothetical protein